MEENKNRSKQLSVEVDEKLLYDFKLLCVKNKVKMKEAMEKAIKKAIELGIYVEK